MNEALTLPSSPATIKRSSIRICPSAHSISQHHQFSHASLPFETGAETSRQCRQSDLHPNSASISSSVRIRIYNFRKTEGCICYDPAYLSPPPPSLPPLSVATGTAPLLLPPPLTRVCFCGRINSRRQQACSHGGACALRRRGAGRCGRSAHASTVRIRTARHQSKAYARVLTQSTNNQHCVSRWLNNDCFARD